MATDINLHINSKNIGDLPGRLNLYFGRSLNCNSNLGWSWVKEQGMEVEGPWAYEKEPDEVGKKISKERLAHWIANGWLSRDPFGKDTSTSFLDEYPDDAEFIISFIDWS